MTSSSPYSTDLSRFVVHSFHPFTVNPFTVNPFNPLNITVDEQSRKSVFVSLAHTTSEEATRGQHTKPRSSPEPHEHGFHLDGIVFRPGCHCSSSSGTASIARTARISNRPASPRQCWRTAVDERHNSTTRWKRLEAPFGFISYRAKVAQDDQGGSPGPGKAKLAQYSQASPHCW